MVGTLIKTNFITINVKIVFQCLSLFLKNKILINFIIFVQYLGWIRFLKCSAFFYDISFCCHSRHLQMFNYDVCDGSLS